VTDFNHRIASQQSLCQLIISFPNVSSTSVRVLLLNATDKWTFYRNLTDGSKRALFTDTQGLAYFQKVIAPKEPPTYIVLKEKIISDYLGIEFPMNHFLFDAYNDKIIQMTETGILQKILEPEKHKPVASDDPVPLSLDHLSIWFLLWIGMLLITAFVFLGEVFVVMSLEKRKRNAVGKQYELGPSEEAGREMKLT
jgi:hypothetical protein